MATTRRQIRLRLEGDELKGGRVSVQRLSKTLRGFQEALLHIAMSRIVPDKHRPRTSISSVKQQCELFLAHANLGSFDATLELPARAATLFPDVQDFAEESLSDLAEVVTGMATNRPDIVQQAVRDPSSRARVIRAVARAIPEARAGYALRVAIASSHELTLRRPSGKQLKAFVGEQPLPEAELPYEATIAAHCRARFSSDGEVQEVVEVFDYDLVDADPFLPYQPSQLSWMDRTFALVQPIHCSVHKEEGLWVIAYDPLGIRAYAASYEGALAEFSQEFALLWDEYGAAEDNQLTGDAVALKRHLRQIVQKVTTE